MPRGAWWGSGLLLLGAGARGPLSNGSGRIPWSLKLFGQERGYKWEQPASCPLAARSSCCPTAKTEKRSQFQGLHFSQALVPHSHILELTQRKTPLTLLPGAPRVKLDNKLPFPAEKVQPTGKWMLLSFKTHFGCFVLFCFVWSTWFLAGRWSPIDRANLSWTSCQPHWPLDGSQMQSSPSKWAERRGG